MFVFLFWLGDSFGANLFAGFDCLSITSSKASQSSLSNGVTAVGLSLCLHGICHLQLYI